MKVLLADDHDLIRDTLSIFLESEDNISVVQAHDFNSAEVLMKTDSSFDLIVLDYDMPGMNKLEGLKRALDITDGKPVSLISGSASKSVAEEALDIGASGFLPKSMAASSLVNALKFMMMGEKYAPIEFMTQVIEDEDHPFANLLTDREIQVLDGLCEGLSNKEIARKIDLQEVTIKLHVKTLCRKLEAKNRTHAAMIAKEAELLKAS